MTACTYKFKDASGEEVTITGQADMKAFLANGGLDQLLPGKVLPWAEKNSLQRDSSWVIKNKKTGEIIMETFDRAKVDALNTEKYEAAPILTHLQSLNGAKSSRPPAIAAESAEDRILTLADIDTLVAGLRDGTVSADAYKAAWQAFQKSADTIKAGLHKLTKPQLLGKAGGMLAYRLKVENKPEIVNAVFDAARDVFSLGRDYGPQGYFMGEYEEYKEAKNKAFADMIDATTADDLKAYADKVAEADTERRQALDEFEKAIEDPQTLDDFRMYATAKIRQGMSESEVRMSLTPEQRARMDELHAEYARKSRASRPAPAVTAASVTTGGDIVATKHTKTGEDLYVVRPAERVERDQYNIWNATAKRMGGRYSSFRGNGAVPGFQFKTRESADAFLAYVGGDTEGAKQVAQERRDAFADDRSQSAVERLTEMADRLEDRADESLSRDRKANTARRARMAASAEASANADKAMARTMRNIANAIKDGKAKFLDKVRQKVQVEMLASFVRDAKYSELTKRYPSYADFERNRYEKPTSETADYAAFPKYTADRADLARMGREMELIEGSKKMGQRLLKVADDATDEYLKFAKANLNKVSTFRLKDGSPAIYSSRDDAESAIARSGFRGKAMVFSVKRGQNLVVMGPAMAKENGLWTADTSKRITLTDEAGEEITDKAESMNRNREKVYLPHQFSATRERRAKLKAMGIESAAEFRAALREFVALSEAPERPSKVKELERAMVGRRNDGLDFFPTPSGVAQQMIEAAGIEEGMSVLEPSAGMGHIAEQIRETGVDPDVVEFSSSRRELLEAKGFNVVANDFMEASGEYDRIIMNPPFSDRRDAEHVRHAFDLLKPGGRIVAIMGEGVFFGQDKKAESFREWLDSVGGSSEKLPDGTFLDPSLPVNTATNARLVVIDKPADAPKETEQGVALYEIDENGDPSPEEAEAVQRGLEGKNPIEAAAWLAENAPMKFAVIAEKVRDKLQSLNDAGVRLGMAIIRAGDIGESALIGARGVTSPSFANGRQSISVAINGADMKGRVGTSYRTALHELVHAATLQPLDQGRKGYGKYAEASRDLDDVGYAVVAHLNERIKNPESLTEFERALSLGRANFLDSPFEVIAWALSSHDAQAYLESIPYKSKSLWTAFVEAVRKVLGLKPGTDTALSEVLRISDILLKPEREGWPGRVPLPGDSHYEVQQPGGGRIFKNPGGRPETNWADAPAVLRDTSALRDGESIPRDQAEAFIRSFVAEFPGAPPIMLADSFSQLPKDLQADAIAQGSSPRRAKGALKAGKAFVVLDNHHSMADLEATVFHEILGHTGIRKLLGPQFSQELNKLFVGLGGYSGLERIMQARGMGQQFEGYFRGIQQARASNPDAWTDALAKSILTEEVFAHIAEQKNAKQLRDRFMALVGMIRDWLRKHGFMDLASLGESDIVFMLQHAREGLRDGSGIVRDGATVGENEIVGEDGRPIAKEGSPEYEALKLLSGRLGLRERSGPTVFRDEPAEEAPAATVGDSKQEAAVFRTDTYAQPRGQAAKEVMGNVISALKEPSAKVFNILHKTISTPLHKASVSKDYAEVFSLAQEYMSDTARFAADPASAAPGLLPAYDSIKQAFNRFMHGDKNAKLKDAVADAIFKGTLAGEDVTSGRVWTDEELRSRFDLGQEQIGLYREARAAIDASLDATAAGLAWQTVKKYIPHAKSAIRSEPGSAETIIDGAMRQAEEELREVARYQATVEADGAIPEGTAAKTTRKAQDVADARKAAESIFLRSDALKAGGYAPLMRFGKYSVDAVRTLEDGTQERITFKKFETEIEAKMEAQRLRKIYPDAEVLRSVMSEDAWKIYKGVDPELVSLFAESLDGVEGLAVKSDVLQEWYRNAVNERSSFKRMVHRKGTDGFDTDVTRVLASFITSNSRLAARQFNMGDMAQAIADMQDRKVSGDVVDEAMGLKEYMDNPEKPFKALKGMMFAFFLGGSVASALLNLTQPIMMTMPYLSQFGAAKAGAALASATKEAWSGKVSDPELSRAMARASKDGVVDPQQIHHLYQEGMRSFIMKLPMGSGLQERAQGFMTMWGMMFGATENFNRRLTFIAAYRMARENPELGNPYDFAAKAVNETQGIYNDANIPNWARGNGSFGAVGVAAFTFKQYSIGYVELLIRLAKSGKNGRAGAAMMLGTLVLMSGMQGAPGADDLEDIIDTVSQYLGYTGNSRLALRKSLESGLGSVFGQETAKAFAHIVMYGGLSVLPGDAGSRIGMGNLFPATAFAKPSEQNRASQIAEIFGPPLGLATQVLDAGLAAESGGGILGVAKAFAPVAVRNWMKAYDMASTGQYSDARGRKVVDVTLGDAALKFVGIQPTVVADDTKDARLVNLTKQRIVQVKSAISSLKAQAIADRDPEMKAKADAMVTDWNQKNPDAPIRINDGAMLRRVKEINTERRERLLKAMPKDFRAIAAKEYE